MRAAAARVCGNVARLHRSASQPAKLRAILEPLLSDGSDASTKAAAQDALDDVAMFGAA